MNKAKQMGYLNIPNGTFEMLGVLAVIGVLTLFGSMIYLAYWLITHVRFV